MNRNVRLPDTAVISITERCNSRCTFCKIWEIGDPSDFDCALIDKLPSSLKNIDLTGGEPLLHHDFEVIVKMLIGRNCDIMVVTNGLVQLNKFRDLWKLPNLGIRFSLDGMAEIHDTLRGIPGNYNKVLEQIEYLKSDRFHNIGLSATFSDANIDQISDLYRLSKQLEIQFGIMVVGNSETYYKKSDHAINDVDKYAKRIWSIMIRELASFNIKKWGRVIYMSELIEFIKGKTKVLNCPAGSKSFFMKPNGEVYLCNMKNILLGDLAKQTFDEIWYSESADKARRFAQNCTEPCWTMCNAKSIILDNKKRYLRRTSWRLMKGLLGR